ncbi:hypothetical protein NDU88_009620 [Pleurodeles waltl]|uniref:Uncharacterized protein n=1 Tax=Pleurodeles waltl TaxID=8319 RepID=A0AAV7S1I6_PLEWA|nr:hypothetical protein NDU88_009620 [Pleurodeles waltl]
MLAYTGSKDFVSWGNELANQSAKWASYGTVEEACVYPLQEKHPEDKLYVETARLYLRELLETALPEEKERWEARSSTHTTRSVRYRHMPTG